MSAQDRKNKESGTPAIELTGLSNRDNDVGAGLGLETPPTQEPITPTPSVELDPMYANVRDELLTPPPAIRAQTSLSGDIEDQEAFLITTPPQPYSPITPPSGSEGLEHVINITSPGTIKSEDHVIDVSPKKEKKEKLKSNDDDSMRIQTLLKDLAQSPTRQDAHLITNSVQPQSATFGTGLDPLKYLIGVIVNTCLACGSQSCCCASPKFPVGAAISGLGASAAKALETGLGNVPEEDSSNARLLLTMQGDPLTFTRLQWQFSGPRPWNEMMDRDDLTPEQKFRGGLACIFGGLIQMAAGETAYALRVLAFGIAVISKETHYFGDSLLKIGFSGEISSNEYKRAWVTQAIADCLGIHPNGENDEFQQRAWNNIKRLGIGAVGLLTLLGDFIFLAPLKQAVESDAILIQNLAQMARAFLEIFAARNAAQAFKKFSELCFAFMRVSLQATNVLIPHVGYSINQPQWWLAGIQAPNLPKFAQGSSHLDRVAVVAGYLFSNVTAQASIWSNVRAAGIVNTAFASNAYNRTKSFPDHLFAAIMESLQSGSMFKDKNGEIPKNAPVLALNRWLQNQYKTYQRAQQEVEGSIRTAKLEAGELTISIDEILAKFQNNTINHELMLATILEYQDPIKLLATRGDNLPPNEKALLKKINEKTSIFTQDTEELIVERQFKILKNIVTTYANNRKSAEAEVNLLSAGIGLPNDQEPKEYLEALKIRINEALANLANYYSAKTAPEPIKNHLEKFPQIIAALNAEGEPDVVIENADKLLKQFYNPVHSEALEAKKRVSEIELSSIGIIPSVPNNLPAGDEATVYLENPIFEKDAEIQSLLDPDAKQAPKTTKAEELAQVLKVLPEKELDEMLFIQGIDLASKDAKTVMSKDTKIAYLLTLQQQGNVLGDYTGLDSSPSSSSSPYSSSSSSSSSTSSSSSSSAPSSTSSSYLHHNYFSTSQGAPAASSDAKSRMDTSTSPRENDIRGDANLVSPQPPSQGSPLTSSFTFFGGLSVLEATTRAATPLPNMLNDDSEEEQQNLISTDQNFERSNLPGHG